MCRWLRPRGSRVAEASIAALDCYRPPGYHAPGRRRRARGLAACPGAKIEYLLAGLGFAGQGNQLAPFILHLDEAALIGGMVIDAAIGRKADAPRAERCRPAAGTSASQCRAKSALCSREGRAARVPEDAAIRHARPAERIRAPATTVPTIARRPLPSPQPVPGPAAGRTAQEDPDRPGQGPKLPHGRSRAAQPAGELLETPVPGQRGDPSILHNAVLEVTRHDRRRPEGRPKRSTQSLHPGLRSQPAGARPVS